VLLKDKVCRVREEIKYYLLRRIADEWKSLPPQSQPWGVWLRYYAPIPEGADKISNSAVPSQVWFLDGRGMREHNIWAFRRFIVVNWEQPWCSRVIKERWAGASSGRHEIGFAAFARYEEGRDVYLEIIWGGLKGRGWRVRFGASETAPDFECLWIS
jgi:hypothetical protein